MLDLLAAHVKMADSLPDKVLVGMFYGWLGFAMECRGRMKDSYAFLHKALDLGEEVKDERTIGYACTWLTWACTNLGLLDEAERHGERAREAARRIPSDPYLLFKSLGGLGSVHYYRGDRREVSEAGQRLLDYGQTHGNIRCQVMGHLTSGRACLIDGDTAAAVEHAEKAIRVSADPFHTYFSKLLLGDACVLLGDLAKAEKVLHESLELTERFGFGGGAGLAGCFLGMLEAQSGEVSHDVRMIEAAQRAYLEEENKVSSVFSELVIRRVILAMVSREQPLRFSTLAKNAGFLLATVPFAGRKAEAHLDSASEVAGGISAKWTGGMASLSLAQLHSAKGKKDKARESILEAIELFSQCDARNYIKQAEAFLASLG